jgi:hypothetical protein
MIFAHYRELAMIMITAAIKVRISFMVRFEYRLTINLDLPLCMKEGNLK